MAEALPFIGDMAAETVGSVAGNAVGSIGGKGGGQPDLQKQITSMVNYQNLILNNARQNAINSSTGYTNQAVGAQNTGMTNASNSLLQYLNQATNQAQQQSLLGNLNSLGLSQAYLNTGGKATDALMTSLGQSVPVVGTANIQKALSDRAASQQAIQLATQQALQKYGINGLAPSNPGSAPTAPTQTLEDIQKSVTIDTLLGYINSHRDPSNPQSIYDLPNGGYGNMIGLDTRDKALAALQNRNSTNNLGTLYDQFTQNQYQGLQDTYNNQLNTYNQNLNTYNSYNNLISQAQAQNALSPMDTSILSAYNQGLFNHQ